MKEITGKQISKAEYEKQQKLNEKILAEVEKTGDFNLLRKCKIVMVRNGTYWIV